MFPGKLIRDVHRATNFQSGIEMEGLPSRCHRATVCHSAQPDEEIGRRRVHDTLPEELVQGIRDEWASRSGRRSAKLCRNRLGRAVGGADGRLGGCGRCEGPGLAGATDSPSSLGSIETTVWLDGRVPKRRETQR